MAGHSPPQQEIDLVLGSFSETLAFLERVDGAELERFKALLDAIDDVERERSPPER